MASSEDLDQENNLAATTSINGQHIPTGSYIAKKKVECLQEFSDVREDDVLVVSYPKSGTHWAMDIVTKLLLDGDIERAKKWARPPVEVYNKAVVSDGEHVKASTWEEAAELPSPRVWGSHLWYENIPPAFKSKNTKIIYIWREWKDAIVSYYEMWTKTFGPLTPWDMFLESRLQKNCRFGLWTDHIRSYQAQVKSGNPNLLVLNYEDMKADLMPTVRRLCSFLGKTELSERTLENILESCSFDATVRATGPSPFLNKGIVGRWKERFTVAQSERVDAVLERDGILKKPFS